MPHPVPSIPGGAPYAYCILRISVRAPFRPISHSDLSSAQACALVCMKAASVLALEDMEPARPLATRGSPSAFGLATSSATLFSARAAKGIRALCGEPPRRAVFETPDIAGHAGASASMATLEFALDRWNSLEIDDFDTFESSIAKLALDLAGLLRATFEPGAPISGSFAGPEAPMSACSDRARELLDLASTRCDAMAISDAIGGARLAATAPSRL